MTKFNLADHQYREYLAKLYEVRSSRPEKDEGAPFIESEKDAYRIRPSFRYAHPVRGASFKSVQKIIPGLGERGGRHATLLRTIRRTPEVMVKISGGGKNLGGIHAHISYITRTDRHAERENKEPVEFEDEQGNKYKGLGDVTDTVDAWAMGKIGVPRNGERRREAFNIVLSMPPGTSPKGVENAARQFARERFSDHQYIFALHTDEAHPHVHLCVKAVNFDGCRLNPRKRDLQQWREHFAARLRENGIEANATPRRARGVTQRAQKQVIRRMDAEYRAGRKKLPSRVSMAREETVNNALNGHPHSNPAADAIQRRREETIASYGQIARLLSRSDDTNDRRTALEIVRFVQAMPSAKTWHEERLEAARRAASGGGKFRGGTGQGRAREAQENVERTR